MNPNPRFYAGRGKISDRPRKEGDPSHARLSATGCSLTLWDNMQEKCKGHCMICGIFKGAALHIDHDHNTGKVRGLLCSGCNTSLGGLGDNEEGLLRALNYLRNGQDFYS